jgi:hypothetical protein
LRALDNPELWRARAIEARALAEHMSDEESCRVMLSIAEHYETMAEQAVRRSAGRQPP